MRFIQNSDSTVCHIVLSISHRFIPVMNKSSWKRCLLRTLLYSFLRVFYKSMKRSFFGLMFLSSLLLCMNSVYALDDQQLRIIEKRYLNLFHILY